MKSTPKNTLLTKAHPSLLAQVHTVIPVKSGFFLLQFMGEICADLANENSQKSQRYSSTSSSVVLALQASAYEQSSELDIPAARHDPARDQLFRFSAWKELKHSACYTDILNKTQTSFSLTY